MSEPERLNKFESRVFPGADVSFQCRTVGSFSPVGCVVHYTACRGTSVRSLIDWANRIDVSQGKKVAYTFHVIDRGGIFYQTHPLDRWGYHAGVSSYRGLGESLSNKLIGVELMSAGMLKNVKVVSRSVVGYPAGVCEVMGQAWFDRSPQKYFARFNDGRFSGDVGWFEAYTVNQESTLVRFIEFCLNSIPSFRSEYIVGHHEISPGRKQDPGAALSITMHELRSLFR